MTYNVHQRNVAAAPALHDIAALIFAGGDGRRLGGQKPTRQLGGRSLLTYAIDAAARHGGRVAIGVRDPRQVDGVGDTELIVDAPGVGGPLASLAGGLAWAERNGARYLLTVPCDAPFLPWNHAARLLGCLLRNDAAAALPRSIGQLHPSCGLWRIDAGRRLPAYLECGRTSLRGFAEHVGFAVEDWGAPARDPFFNVNTPEDLEIAESWLG